MSTGFFIFYIGIMVVGILNIITSLFVETALHISKMDRDLGAQEEIERSVNLMVDLKELFKEIDLDSNEVLTFDEFSGHLKREKVQAYFMRLGLDTSDVKALFRALDVDKNGVVEIDEFVMGCIRLMGSARAVNVTTLIYEQRMVMDKLNNGIRCLDEHLDTIEVRVQMLLANH